MGHLISIAFPTLGNLTKSLGPRDGMFIYLFHCILLHFIAFYCILLNFIVFYGFIVFYCILLYSIVKYCKVL